MEWYQGKLRKMSPYFTRMFLKVGITANQITVMSVVFAVLGASLFLFKSPDCWILAWMIMQLYPLLDCVDGEIVRHKRGLDYTEFGIKIDEFMHPLVNGIVLVFATIGLYLIYPILYVVVFGISAVFFIFLNRLAKISFQVKKSTSKTSTHRFEVPLGGMIHAFLVPSVLDVFFSDFRLLFLILLGIGIPVVFLRNIVNSYVRMVKNK